MLDAMNRGPSPAEQDTAQRRPTALDCLAIVMQLHRVPADPERLAHDFGAGRTELDVTHLVRAARRSGVKAKLTRSAWARLHGTPLPAIVRLRDGRYAVLAAASQEKVLVQTPWSSRPSQLSQDEFEAPWTGELILCATRASLAGEDRRFDFTWFIPPIIKYRALFGEVLAASFFLQIFALVSPLFFQVVIDKVLVHQSMTTLDVIVLGLVVVGIFEALLGALRTYIFAHTTNRVDVELGSRMFSHLLALPLAYFSARRVGDSVARVRELETVRSFITGSSVTVVVDLMFATVFVAVMFFYSRFLAWIAVSILPLYVVLSLVVTPILRQRLDEKFRRGAENQAFLVESITGVETIKSMAVEPQLQHRWEQQLGAYVGAAFRASQISNVAQQASTLVSHLSSALILWFGARLVIDGTLTVGELVAFNMMSGRLTSPILRLAGLWQDFQQVRISLHRLGDILNTRRETQSAGGRSSLPSVRGDLEFDRVTFRYRPDGPEILRSLSLRIPAGQVVGIVGASGSGKSTLTRLIQRIHVPEAGRILIDGMDTAVLDVSQLRRQMGIVLQENVLFTGTVRENIALVDPGMPLERVVEAATLAGAHGFIAGLAHGYDTMIGERGASLSGGQRQRIAIARALAGRPRILLLDEATSALDAESEQLLQENLGRICAGRTVLLVTHRLSSLRAADRVLVLDQGSIVEDGAPRDLLRAGGRFARLVSLQNASLSREDADASAAA